MNDIFASATSFNDASRLIQRFHAAGQIMPALPDGYTVPVMVGVDVRNGTVASIEAVMTCDFSACGGIVKQVEGQTRQWLAQGFYQTAADAMATRVDPVFGLVAHSFSKMLCDNRNADAQKEARRNELRDRLYKDRRMVHLSDAFARKVNVCSENAAMAKHMLDRAGIPASYVSARIYVPDARRAEAHAFLVVRQNGVAVVYDPSVWTYAPYSKGMPDLRMRDANGRVPLPAIFSARLEDFDRMLDKGRKINSWVRMESIWKGASANARMYYGFSLYPSGDTVKIGLVNPRRPG